MGAWQAMFQHLENVKKSLLELSDEDAPDFDGSTMGMRASSGGKYISLTITITATSRDQLDNFYRALTAHPLVKYAL